MDSDRPFDKNLTEDLKRHVKLKETTEETQEKLGKLSDQFKMRQNEIDTIRFNDPVATTNICTIRGKTGISNESILKTGILRARQF